MAKRLYETDLKKAVVSGVEQIVELSEIAKSVEFTIVIKKDSAPTVSYKVDELPIRFDMKGE